MRTATTWALVLAIGIAFGTGSRVWAGDDGQKEEGAKKVADGTKQITEGAKDVVKGTATEAEKGITGFFKGLPWFTSPLALVLGLVLGFVIGKIGPKGGAPKKPGGDKKK